MPRMCINVFTTRHSFQDQWMYVGNLNIHLSNHNNFCLSLKVPVFFGQVDNMEESAQRRVWTGKGKDAALRGLV